MARGYTSLPKRTTLTYKQRLQVCEFARANPKLRHVDVADWAQRQFRLPKEPSIGAIRKICQDEAKWKAGLEEAAGDDSMRRKGTVQAPQVEAMLLKWVAEQPSGQRIKGREIQAKAEEFAEIVGFGDGDSAKRPKFSKGWLAGFEERYKINGKGGSGSLPSSKKRPSLSDPIPTRIVLTYKQRKELCEYAAANPTLNRTQLAAWATEKFHLRKYISNHTVRNILDRAAEWESVSAKDAKTMRHHRAPVLPELDTLLAHWVGKRKERSIKVTGKDIIARAQVLAQELAIPEEDQPKFSKGWLASFMTRHKFVKPRLLKRAKSTKATETTTTTTAVTNQEESYEDDDEEDEDDGDNADYDEVADASTYSDYYDNEESEEEVIQPQRKKGRVDHLLN